MLSERPDRVSSQAVLTTTISKELLMATNTLAQQQTVRSNGSMQRRHFELIAEIIAKKLDEEFREKAEYAFAYILPMTNANVDSQGFLRACKVSAFTESDNG